MGDVGIFHEHLVYFADILYILWLFGIFCCNLVFSSILVYCTMKNLATPVDVLSLHNVKSIRNPNFEASISRY
jgi:hypothetical protein